MEQLSPVAPSRPLGPAPSLSASREIVDRVFWYSLGRAPSVDERREAEKALQDPAHRNKPCADGLADLLWAVMMKPEFQLIY